jgi:hypothetical protein
MDAGRPEEVESQDRLREKTIPFAEWELGVDSAENRNKMVFEGANSTFSSIGTMFFGGDSLILDLILHEGILEVLRAFVVQDVEVWGMALVHKSLVGLFPGVADTGGFAIRNGDSMNGICVLMVKDKDIVVSTAGWNGEATGLIGVGLQVLLIVKEYDRNLMRSRFKCGGNIIINDDDLRG